MCREEAVIIVIKTPSGQVDVVRIDNSGVLFRHGKTGSLARTILCEHMSMDDFIKTFIANVKAVEFIVYSTRRYGQPKLEKPKELAGIDRCFTVDFIPNKCGCPCYVLGDDLWIKHKDWFSQFIPKSEAQRRKTFIFNDDFSSVVLRNEAWLRISNILSVIQKESILTVKAVILNKMAETLGLDYCDLCIGVWDRFFENVIITTREDERATSLWSNYIERVLAVNNS